MSNETIASTALPTVSDEQAGKAEVFVSNMLTPDKFPTQGLVTVPLYYISTNIFKNYRKTVPEEHLASVCLSLGDNRSGQQLHNVCARKEPTVDGISFLGLFAGFCRIECMRRNALEALIDEYNQSFGYNPGQQGYINIGGKGFESHFDREMIRAISPEWATKYDNALKAYPVGVNIQPISDSEARKKNAEENLKRLDASLWDTCVRIVELSNDGIPGKELATLCDTTPGAVSQMKQICSFPEYYLKLVEDKKASGSLSDAGYQNCLNAIDEFVERCAITKKMSDKALGISHAREFVGAAMHKNEALSFDEMTGMLKYLVCMDDSGLIREEAPPLYPIFISRLKQAKVRSNNPVSVVPAVAATPVDDGTPLMAPGQLVDVGDIANEQKLQAQLSTGKSAEAELAAANQQAITAGVASGATPTTPPVAAVTPMTPEQEAQKALEAMEGTPTDQMIQGDHLLDDEGDDEDFVAPTGEFLDNEGESEQNLTGAKRVSAIDAPNIAVNMLKPPDLMVKQAQQYIDSAANADPDMETVIDIATYGSNAATIYGMLGAEAAFQLAYGSSCTYIEEANQWLDEVLDTLKQLDVEKYTNLQAQKPKYVRPA